MRGLLRVFRLILAVMLVAGVLSPSSVRADGGEGAPLLDSGDSGENGAVFCATEEELLRLLERDAGGVIALSHSILVEEYHPSVSVTRPVTVLMGGHGLAVSEDGELNLYGPVRFEGERPGQTLISTAGVLQLNGGAAVFAKGDGVTALHLEDNPYTSLKGEMLTISAEGAGATALWSESDNEKTFTLMDISARGEDSVGVRGNGRLRFFLCRVSGEGAAVETSGSVCLDASQAEPRPAGAEVVERRAAPTNWLLQTGFSAVQGKPIEDVWGDFGLYPGRPNPLYYNLYDTAGQILTSIVSIQGLWEGLPEDCSRAGEYPLTCTPLEPEWLTGMFPSFSVPLHVVPQGQPWIQDLFVSEFGGVQLRFLSPVAPEKTAVQYSANNGRSWRYASSLPNFFAFERGAYFEGLKKNHLYLLRLRVEGEDGVRYSNTLEFPYTDKDPQSIGGGDSDQGDRWEQGSLPGDTVVPPPDEVPAGEGPGAAGEPPSPPPASAPPPEADATLTPGQLQAQLAANPQGVVLIGEGIRVVLPAPWVEALAPGEALSVQHRLEGDRFTVRFWAGDRPLEGAEGLSFLTDVVWSREGAFLCTDAAGAETPAQVLPDGRLRFQLAYAGEYRIRAAEDAAPAQGGSGGAVQPPQGEAGVGDGAEAVHTPMPILPLALGAVLCAAAAALLLRKRLGKGGGDLG